MIRAGDTGRHRHAIAVAVRAPDTDYETTKIPELHVEPGGEVRLVVRVHNLSAKADTLHLAVEGIPDGWADVHPATLRLVSDQHGEADVSVRFPHTPSTKAASWPIRVVVHSGAHGRRVSSGAAVVHITPHPVLEVALTPSDLHTRRRARGELRIVNTGNAPADVELSARDGDGRLGFRLTPAKVRVEAGGEASASVEVSAPRHRWLGRPALAPLMVEAQADTARATALATFQQRAVLPRWVFVVPVFAAAAAVWMVSRPTEVSVPRVAGLTVAQARERLAQVGLKAKQAAMPAADPRHPQPGVVDQAPDAGVEVRDGSDVTISYEAAGGVATVTPKVDASSVAPPPGESEPLAYVRENRIFVRFPGENELSIAGAVGFVSSQPAWDPATGEVAYVRRRSPEAEAEIVAVDPRAPGGERDLTAPGRSYTSPAFSRSGTLMASIAEDRGELCITPQPGTSVQCRTDDRWRYGQPVFADDGTLYVLRREATSASEGWEELVRVPTDTLEVDRKPVLRGDLRSVAIGRDGRIAAVMRRAGDPGYHVEVFSPEGAQTDVETNPSASCAVAWSGEDLIISRGSCEGDGQIVQLEPAQLDAPATPLVDGDEPAVAG